jgi:hypothetical protein
VNISTWSIRAGLLIGLGLLTACAGRREVSLDDTPAPVHRTILAHLDGGDIVQVERDENDGRFVYYTEVQRGDENWEVLVDEDGEYLGRGDPK